MAEKEFEIDWYERRNVHYKTTVKASSKELAIQMISEDINDCRINGSEQTDEPDDGNKDNPWIVITNIEEG